MTRFSSYRGLMIFQPGLSIWTKKNKKIIYGHAFFDMIIITNIFQVIKHSHSFTSFTKCHLNEDGLNHMLTLLQFWVDYTVSKASIFGSRLRSSCIFVVMHGCEHHTARAKHNYRWLPKKKNKYVLECSSRGKSAVNICWFCTILL